ncbi:MAG TPA: pyridoxal-phosphate dependent enzyme, partial [Acidimicrobiales bacterium]
AGTGTAWGRAAVTPDDVLEANERIAGRVRVTPVMPLRGTNLLIKCEHLQLTGSFKLRGATNALLAGPPLPVVTGSSGNHGKALVWAARAAGLPQPTVVMTSDSSREKQAVVRVLGGRVVISGPGTEMRAELAHRIARDEQRTYISSYDDPLVIAGQGTVGLELAQQCPDATTVVVPLGGGGLLAGVALALRRWAPRVRIIGVEPRDADDTIRSLAGGRRVTIDVPTTICDGARAQSPGELTFPIVRALVDEVVAVSDDDVRDAMRLLAADGHRVEPTGALAVAGARALGGGVVAIVSGGNISIASFAELVRTDAAGAAGGLLVAAGARR